MTTAASRHWRIRISIHIPNESSCILTTRQNHVAETPNIFLRPDMQVGMFTTRYYMILTATCQRQTFTLWINSRLLGWFSHCRFTQNQLKKKKKKKVFQRQIFIRVSQDCNEMCNNVLNMTAVIQLPLAHKTLRFLTEGAWEKGLIMIVW